MKIKKEFVIKELMGEYIVVPVGKTPLSFNGIITLNDVGCFLWKQLQKEVGIDELVQKVLDEYEVDESTARNDVKEFLDYLTTNQLLDDE